jgi:hypothetical protein
VSPGRRRALLVAAAVLLVGALVVGVTSGIREQHRLHQAQQVEQAQRTTLAVTRAGVTDQRRKLSAAGVYGKALAGDLVDANADVTLTDAFLVKAREVLAHSRETLGSQTARRATVETCLRGVRQALDATRTLNTIAATAFLRAVAPACQSALTPAGERPPVLAFDFADPFVVRAGNQYFAYATNAAGGAVQEARGTALDHWELDGNALANIPSWALPGSVWSPAVLPRADGALLFYTVRQASTGRQCLTVAVGSGPGGPFLDGSSGPLECGDSGAIDPSPFVDANGNAHLLYKTERPARLWSRPLAPDGRTFSGPSSLLLASTQRWENGNVEAPSMLRNGSTYWLFYSGNDWNGEHYAEGVARCSSPAGPCTADSHNPILASRAGAAGPGGGEVFTDTAGNWWLAYHAYQEPLVGYPNSRLLYFSPISLDPAGRPTISS